MLGAVWFRKKKQKQETHVTSRLRNLACPQFNAESMSTLETGLGSTFN